uniref:Ribosome-recycling factor, chloroplastic n=1 Tax=Kalanchoe fedtschenkoi TaxID=63787 RepID=A0A7N0SYE7_KALFE
MAMSFSPVRSFLQSKPNASLFALSASFRDSRCKGSDYVRIQSASSNASALASSSSYVRIQDNVGRFCCKEVEKKLMCKRVGVVRCATIEEIEAERAVVEKDVRERMERTIENVKTNFNSIRTGRASPSMLDRIEVEYYGTPVSLKSIAQITCPDASSLLVQPYDKSSLKLIEKAIVNSDLGVTPSNDGEVIRLTVPQPTADRRKELLKIVAKQTEEGRVALRNIRRDGVKAYEKLEKEKKLSEDNVKDLEADLKKVLDEYLKKLEDVYKQKEKELLKV